MNPSSEIRWLDYSDRAFLSKARELAYAGTPFGFCISGRAGEELSGMVRDGVFLGSWIPLLLKRDLRYFAGAYQFAQIADRSVAFEFVNGSLQVQVGGGPAYSSRDDGTILD
jgi:hypothetical protein